MKWLTTIGNVVRWILGIVPPPPAAPKPKPPLTPHDLGWDDASGKPLAGPLDPKDKP
jgi:hypothetical protein